MQSPPIPPIKMEIPKIHLIGRGRLGRSLSQTLTQKNIPHTLYGRDYPRHLHGWIYICTPEDSIASIASELCELDDSDLLCHASGSLGLEVLSPHRTNIGCLHPIQSFTGQPIAKDEPTLDIPTSIPATFQTHPAEMERLFPRAKCFADLLNFEVIPYTGSRLRYHTAAVVGGNFLSILFSIATEFLIQEGLNPLEARNLLYPLASKSLFNASQGSLSEILTGPIARKQSKVLEQQYANLENDPHVQQLYHHIVQAALDRITKD